MNCFFIFYIYCDILFLVIILKLLFKNITKYDTNTYNEFLEFHRNKFYISYTFFTAIITIALFYIISMQVIFHNITIAIVICIVLTIFFIWRFLYPASEVKRDYNSTMIQNKEEFTFLFYEKYFKIKNKLNYNIIKYSNLYKVFETNNFFYLYINKSHSLILNKTGFKNNSSQDFSKFIKNKCLLKYKKINSPI